MKITAAAVALLCLAGCGPTELRVTMKSDNNSGQTGFAVLEDLGEQIRVTVETTIPTTGDTPQTAHIHDGDCGEIGPVRAGLDRLEKLGEGRFGSTTVVSLTFKTLAGGKFAINAHDATDPAVYVSCGEVPKQ